MSKLATSLAFAGALVLGGCAPQQESAVAFENETQVFADRVKQCVARCNLRGVTLSNKDLQKVLGTTQEKVDKATGGCRVGCLKFADK